VARATFPRKASKKQAWKQSSKQSSSFVLILIGLFKLFKALLLIAVGVGAIKFLHQDLAGAATHWVQVLRVDPDNRFIHGILVRIFRVTPKQLMELSVGTFLYAGLFATEGVGLVAAKTMGGIFHHRHQWCVHPD
jgi:hypothetical protein